MPQTLDSLKLERNLDICVPPSIPRAFMPVVSIAILSVLFEGQAIGSQSGASLMVQPVKNPPAMQETWVQPLGWENPLEKEMATHSRVLAGKISWTEEPCRLQSMGLQQSWI